MPSTILPWILTEKTLDAVEPNIRFRSLPQDLLDFDLPRGAGGGRKSAIHCNAFCKAKEAGCSQNARTLALGAA